MRDHHRAPANCPDWALRWYQRALRRAAIQQPTLWETTTARADNDPVGAAGKGGA
jgi:hypothetical protein